MTSEHLLPIAAIVTDPNCEADTILLDFAFHLKKSGYRVRGLIQQKEHSASGCQVWLRDVNNGDLYPISQRLGSLSTSCQIDTGSMAEAGIVMRRINADNTDLVIFNRFSGLEAEGQGFAQEMLALMSIEIPVLAIVSRRHLSAWRHFTGNLACELAPDPHMLNRWFSALHAVRRHAEFPLA